MTVNRQLVEFMRARRIDSCQKLRLLLFFHQQAGRQSHIHDLAQQLYLGHTPLLEEILGDLQSVGLLNCSGDCYTLHNEPGLSSILQYLAQTIEDPLARQEILDHIKYGLFSPHQVAPHWSR